MCNHFLNRFSDTCGIRGSVPGMFSLRTTLLRSRYQLSEFVRKRGLRGSERSPTLKHSDSDEGCLHRRVALGRPASGTLQRVLEAREEHEECPTASRRSSISAILRIDRGSSG